jgi:hypothetical protein
MKLTPPLQWWLQESARTLFYTTVHLLAGCSHQLDHAEPVGGLNTVSLEAAAINSPLTL